MHLKQLFMPRLTLQLYDGVTTNITAFEINVTEQERDHLTRAAVQQNLRSYITSTFSKVVVMHCRELNHGSTCNTGNLCRACVQLLKSFGETMSQLRVAQPRPLPLKCTIGVTGMFPFYRERGGVLFGSLYPEDFLRKLGKGGVFVKTNGYQVPREGYHLFPPPPPRFKWWGTSIVHPLILQEWGGGGGRNLVQLGSRSRG